MSGENNGVSNATDQNASGADQSKTKPIDDVVTYETHKKLLGQKKSVEQENEALKKQLKDIEEKKLQESGEWQKIAKLKEEETAKFKSELEAERKEKESLTSVLIQAQKLQAVKEKLPGKLENPDYMSFIDIDKVILNPETGEIDESSVESVVQSFVKTHPKLLKADTKFLPNGNASAPGKLTHEDWLKLPVAQKRLRMKDVAVK